MSWNPDQYLKYSNERMRPALDLLARIDVEAPATVLDLGCGAGNVTALLAERWPEARIVGVDNSTEMLAKARAATAGDSRREWIDADLGTYAPDATADVVYSNAALHWQPDHSRLFPRIFDWVAPGGVLAVQMPNQLAAPSHVAIAEVVAMAPWRDRLAGTREQTPVLQTSDYFRLLSPKARTIDAWVSEYLHVLPAAEDGVHPVVAWIKGTTLTPYLAALPEHMHRAFMDHISQRISAAYAALPDGRVLFPFRRIFVVAARASQ